MILSATIIGAELASKANSRRIVGKGRIIKSQKALDWLAAARRQIAPIDPLIACPVKVIAGIRYRTMRPDLDASLLFDVLQGVWIVNDRQIVQQDIVREKCGDPCVRVLLHTLPDWPDF